jgi:cell shape-determining protein MreC
MDGIRDLLAQLAVQPSTNEDAADPKRALMAAIAKSALNIKKESQNNKFNSGSSTVLKDAADINSVMALIPQTFTLLQQQQQEIRELKTSIHRIETLCMEIQKMASAHTQPSSLT